MRIELDQPQAPPAHVEPPWPEAVVQTPPAPQPAPHPELTPLVEPPPSAPVAEPAVRPEPQWRHGWPVPSTISLQPDEARACICLPEFGATILEQAHAIADRFPAAENEFRSVRAKPPRSEAVELPHFEKVFRIAAAQAGIAQVQNAMDYDELLVLTAWLCVRPQTPGYLGSYPKALLCPLSHAAPPSELDTLPQAKRMIFDRRAPVYLRYLLGSKFNLRTCADLENADLRQLLRSAGFRLVRASAVPEFVYAGSTRGEDPPIRPWKLTLRQELTDDQAAELLIQAALWQIKHGLQLVSFNFDEPQWNIGAFERTDWEDAFLSLGVRVSPQFTRDSGLLDWRAVLNKCLAQIGTGNLPADVLGKVSAVPQRVRHDDHQAIWDVLDRAARTVVARVRETEPQLFTETGELDYLAARSYRRWARLFDEVSPQILSRLGVSAFTALHRVAPEYFGWTPGHLKPWELEQEHGKWKGPRGRALLRSAYAFALYEAGLGSIQGANDQVVWQCTLTQFSDWVLRRAELRPYDFLYSMASRHGLTPLLSRDVTHTAAVSLLAGMNVHQNLPRIENCWDLCLRTALERHGGQLEVRLVLPDLVPLPLRLRKAVMTPLPYSYLHKEIRLVRDFDLRMARESHRKLEELPGWWDDERIIGTPLFDRVNDRANPAPAALLRLNPELWLETPAQKIRFRALQLLISPRATDETVPGEPGGLTAAEMRALLQLALDGALTHSNVMQVSHPAIRRGFERLLARDDTREMLDSLLLHIGTAYETEIWGQVRKFIVLDVINDLLALTIRTSLLHLLSTE